MNPSIRKRSIRTIAATGSPRSTHSPLCFLISRTTPSTGDFNFHQSLFELEHCKFARFHLNRELLESQFVFGVSQPCARATDGIGSAKSLEVNCILSKISNQLVFLLPLAVIPLQTAEWELRLPPWREPA